MNKSAAGTAFKTMIFMVFTGCLIALSLFWSLGQTILFTNIIFFNDGIWGTVAGLLIQFGPQVFLMLAHLSKDNDNERVIWYFLFWFFSAMDAGTNIGARMERNTNFVGIVGYKQWAIILGYVLDIVVVFAEEMIGYALGATLHGVGLMLAHFGGTPPRWLLMGEDVAKVIRPPARRNKKSRSPKRRRRPRNQSQKQKTHNSNLPLPLGSPVREQSPIAGIQFDRGTVIAEDRNQ